MKKQNLIWGAILIALGLGFLVFQLVPGLSAALSWPWILVALGSIFAISSLISRTGGLMIPGTILLGLSAIFLWQEQTNNWDSWAYIWTVIPGFVGLGMFIGGLYDEELAQARGASLLIMLISIVALAIFGGFLGMDAGILSYWPILLIVAGLFMLARSFRRGSSEKSKEELS